MSIYYRDYKSKPIIRQAFEISSGDLLSYSKRSKCVTLNRGGSRVAAACFETPKIGDFICKIDDSDIYHVRRSVFLERNEVTL